MAEEVDKKLVIGIDLGSAYSHVGILRNGSFENIPDELGNRYIPSVVAFTDDDILVGEEAKNQAFLNPKRTIYNIKGLIGRKYNDKEVQMYKKIVTYDIIDKDGKPYIPIEIKGQKKLYSPEEISAMILTKIKKTAENFLGTKVENAVITVPAYFNESQRYSTKNAGTIAGLNVMRIINEPTAAAIAYDLDQSKSEINILVLDLGYSTFDVSFLAMDSGVFEIISTNSDTHLGEEDFDKRILDYFLKRIKNQYGKDLKDNKSAIQKLKAEIEKTKKNLFNSPQTTLKIDELEQGFDFKDTLSREKIEELNMDLFKKTMDLVEKVIENSKEVIKEDSEYYKNNNEINEIVVIGTSSYIPIIQTLIKNYFKGKEPIKGINPDEAVANGAAIQGAILAGEKYVKAQDLILFDDDTPLTLGLSTGGAKDSNNFRENIKNGYFPIYTDITYNGLFYDYYFDTGKKNESKNLFSPSYSCAISKDPISYKNEYYMTVGLNSNIKESDFQRKKLNLVVALDISSSMSSTFSSYYYDAFLEDCNENSKSADDKTSKMEIANESVNILIDQLKDDDRLGIVLFNHEAYVAKKIELVSEMDRIKTKKFVSEIKESGGTNLEAGYIEATKLFEKYENSNKSEYENRIIIISDEMPNYGETSLKDLLSYIKDNAEKGIFTTFIGIGVDFNTALTEEISNAKGANYYSVHNSSEFKKRMGEQFDYMVSPLVFDLNLNFNSDDYDIEMVYGSDSVNGKNGNLIKINTLFPSKTSEKDEVKGGIVLVKLSKKTKKENGTIKLEVSYEDRNGEKYNNSQIIAFGKKEEFYESSGIRKAIVLTRYVNIIKNWILYERTDDQRYMINQNKGIEDLFYTKEEVINILGDNERTSVELKVSEEYKKIISNMKEYIQKENEEIKDDSLNKEIDVLNELISKK